MKVLLDTHALLWWLGGDERLSAGARAAIHSAEHTVLVSAVSAWEVATKFRIGKLPGAEDAARDMAGCLRSQGFVAVPITLDQAQRAGLLPGHHRDPFDRMLIAQAQAENLSVMTGDPNFSLYEVALVI